MMKQVLEQVVHQVKHGGSYYQKHMEQYNNESSNTSNAGGIQNDSVGNSNCLWETNKQMVRHQQQVQIRLMHLIDEVVYVRLFLSNTR